MNLLLQVLMCGSPAPPDPPPKVNVDDFVPPTVEQIKPAKKRKSGSRKGGFSAFSLRRSKPTTSTGGGGGNALSIRN